MKQIGSIIGGILTSNSTAGATDRAESHRIALQALAEHSHATCELVEEIYRSELLELEQGARVTQYLSPITTRRVRDRLRQSPHARLQPRVPTPGQTDRHLLGA